MYIQFTEVIGHWRAKNYTEAHRPSHALHALDFFWKYIDDDIMSYIYLFVKINIKLKQ